MQLYRVIVLRRAAALVQLLSLFIIGLIGIHDCLHNLNGVGVGAYQSSKQS